MITDLEKTIQYLREVEEDKESGELMYIFTILFNEENTTNIDFARLSEKILLHAYDAMHSYVEMESWESEEDNAYNAQNPFQIWYSIFEMASALTQLPPERRESHNEPYFI